MPHHHDAGCAAVVVRKGRILGRGRFVTGVQFYHDARGNILRKELKKGKKGKRRQAISNGASGWLIRKCSLGSCNSEI